MVYVTDGGTAGPTTRPGTEGAESGNSGVASGGEAVMKPLAVAPTAGKNGHDLAD